VIEPGQSVEVTMTIVDDVGNPIADRACAFAVAAQPGSDAYVTALSPVTDADGQATALLHVGSSQGTVQVLAVCGDIIRLAEVAVVLPPASLPDTGVPAQRDDSGLLLLIELSLALGMLGGLAIAARRSRLAS
jgi:hypothetical protein